MRIAGVGETSLTHLGVPDQEAVHHIADVARALAGVIAGRGIRFAITHAYEGGHPDHDAVACAAYASCRLLERRGHAVSLYEMPLYHQGVHQELRQTFAPHETAHDTAAELSLFLGADARLRKKRMLACYTTQSHTLSGFAIGPERFRQMPRYDFTALPNRGALLYERHDWGVQTGAEWKELAGRALVELDLIE
jgi:N-acetylglucosamine malate deacetylase 2